MNMITQLCLFVAILLPPVTSAVPAQGLSRCCALAVDNGNVQEICSYMEESCGGWEKCNIQLDSVIDEWCSLCVVYHLEDLRCTQKYFPINPPKDKREELASLDSVDIAGEPGDTVGEANIK
jgi:hypothetical protein